MRTVVSAYKQELLAELRTAADQSPGKALSVYIDIQSRIAVSPQAMRGAADNSLGKAVSAYGDIQKQIDSSPAALNPGFPLLELLAGYSVSFITIVFLLLAGP